MNKVEINIFKLKQPFIRTYLFGILDGVTEGIHSRVFFNIPSSVTNVGAPVKENLKQK